MAKWRVSPGTANNSIHSEFEVNRGEEIQWKIQQDEKPYLEEVKRDKELLNSGRAASGYRKMATIPDIVAIEMLQKHRLDIHDPSFMHEPANMKRLRYILQTEYPHLIVST